MVKIKVNKLEINDLLWAKNSKTESNWTRIPARVPQTWLLQILCLKRERERESREWRGTRKGKELNIVGDRVQVEWANSILIANQNEWRRCISRLFYALFGLLKYPFRIGFSTIVFGFCPNLWFSFIKIVVFIYLKTYTDLFSFTKYISVRSKMHIIL